MKTYTNNSFTGHYPVGSAAVVLAKSRRQAADRLNSVLQQMGLSGDAKPEDMMEFPAEDDKEIEVVRVLVDGDY